MSEVMTQEKPRTRTRNTVELVMVVRDDNGSIVKYIPVDLPTTVGDDTSRVNVIKQIKKSAEKGETVYDNKELVVISYQRSFKLSTEKVRKITIS